MGAGDGGRDSELLVSEEEGSGLPSDDEDPLDGRVAGVSSVLDGGVAGGELGQSEGEVSRTCREEAGVVAMVRYVEMYHRKVGAKGHSM